MIEIMNLFLFFKYQRYYLKHKVMNRTEKGLENKLHSAAVADMFLPFWIMQIVLPGLLPQSLHAAPELRWSFLSPVSYLCLCHADASHNQGLKKYYSGTSDLPVSTPSLQLVVQKPVSHGVTLLGLF